VDLIHALSAKYCIRQDARGFIELWGLSIALAAAAIAVRREARVWAGLLACLILLTVVVALTIFWWCYQSATATLGMVLPNSYGTFLNTMSCMSTHAVETIDEWILLVLSFIAAIGLVVLGILRLKSLAGRALTFTGAAVALLFAAANGFLILFGLAWCQSSRLF
jgi:hypothetical protein